MKNLYLAIFLAFLAEASFAKTFADYCQDKMADVEIKRTVKEVLGFYNTAKCESPQQRIDAGEDYLKLTGTHIRDIRPIAALKGLKWVTITRSRIADLSPFAGYDGLERFMLIASPARDISPLFSISSLRTLWAYRINATSIEGIGKLKKLRGLVLQETPIQDFSPLGSLANLEMLSVGHERGHSEDHECEPQVSPPTGFASAVAKLKKLDSIVASGIGLRRADFIPNKAQVQTLDLSCNDIVNIDGFDGLTKLSTLNLTSNPLKNINALRNLPNLVNLGLASTGIDSIAVLSEHTKLLNVIISHNNITDLSPLVKSPRIQKVYAAHNKVTDFSVLAKLPKLRSINLGNNPIKQLPNMKGFVALRFLSLQNTHIDSLIPFKGYDRLRSVNLSNIGNLKVKELNYLADSELRTLRIDNNSLTDLSSVSHPTVSFVSASNNYLSDPEKLGDFPSLIILEIDNNPIATAKGLCSRYENLADLSIANTSIPDLRDLLACEELSSLNISQSPIRDFDNLISFPKPIDYLTISGLGLDNIEFLRELALHSLDISNNAIDDLEPLASHTDLMELKADSNAITSVQPLAGLAKLSFPYNLSLKDNPLGTTTSKNSNNCPSDALGSALAIWCAGQ